MVLGKCELIIIAWNLSGFFYIITMNQFIAVPHSLSKIFNVPISFFYLHIIASSASFIKRNKPFLNKLKRTGPGMDPWGTPDNKIW